MIAYLAHPIDYASGQHSDEITHVKRELERAGYWVYHPARAWSVVPETEPDKNVYEINMCALARCDLLVAMLWRDSFTIGTIIELVKVVERRTQRAVIVGDINRSVSTEALGVKVYRTIGEALA